MNEKFGLIAIDRAPENGEVWAVTYKGREEVSLGLGWALPVIAQPDNSEPYPNAYEGEVVLDHPNWGYVIVQSIDCDYEGGGGELMVECPNHGGNFDCTPFCAVCEGKQEYEGG